MKRLTTTLRYWLLRGFIFFAPLGLMACTTTGTAMPEEVLVPVPVPCEIEQVEPTELPTAAPDADIWELAKVAAARLRLIEAENVRLRAANTTPCPGGE